MQLSDILDVLKALAKIRRLFWSEDDFKFAFATQLQVKFGAKAEVRLEKRYERGGQSAYTDITVRMDGKSFPIELKYKTAKGAYADANGEIIELLTHSAVDLGCYSYLKDIERLEYLAKNDSEFERGFAIMLTNESGYYKDTRRASVYDAFKIYEGKQISGTLDWDRKRYNGNEPSWVKSHDGFALKNSYRMHWMDYGSELPPADEWSAPALFKYQIAVIEKSQKLA